jgi:hypothetical protein
MAQRPITPAMAESPQNNETKNISPPTRAETPIQVVIKPSSPPITPKLLPYILKEPELLTKSLMGKKYIQPNIYKVIRPQTMGGQFLKRF